MWTRFMDMYSGGSCKQKPYEYIYIEAPEAEAKVIFYNRFGHNPERVTCTCCGDDYSIEDYDTLERATAYDRGCQHGRGNDEGYNLASAKVSVDDYVARPDVLVVPEADIKPQERTGEVPVQGYVWQD